MSYFPYKIHCDMDGVLVDFERGVVAAINKQLVSKDPFRPKAAAKIFKELGRNYITLADIKKDSSTSSSAARSYMYALVEDNEDWWATLPWQPGGKKLWSYIKQFNPEILTAPMDKGGKTGSLAGKRRWVEKNLKIDPNRIIFEHEKWKYAVLDNGEQNILIDDFKSKIEPWDTAGGIGILHINANTTIKILKLLKKTHEAS
jgi:5'(3')-deoxyribonucleotidase